MRKEGILVVVSGFSGAGKGTIMKSLLSRYPNYGLSISATTRKPRGGEVDAKDYFFLTKEQFEEGIEQGQFIEYAQYVENYYGTPKKYVQEQMKNGIDVILEIEMQGALKIKEAFPDSLLLFIVPPSAKELKKRLIERGTETMEVIEQRLGQALEEAKGLENYDYIVVNDDIDECMEQTNQIIQVQHHKTVHNHQFLTQLAQELKTI